MSITPAAVRCRIDHHPIPANGKLLPAENGSGKISVITVHGDKASVTVIKEGLKTPTAVEPAGDTIWVAERGAGKAMSIPMPDR
jgi:hypothetical protein